MDPSIIGNVDSLYALLGLGIIAITILILDQRRRQDKGPAVAAAAGTSETESGSNGHSVSANYVAKVVAENCRECPRVEALEKRLDHMTERLDQIYILLGGKVH